MTNRLLTPVGATAATPFYFEKAYINVYTIEELNYVLFENAFLIDKDIVNRSLINWIDSELKLHDLAKDLYALANQNASPGAFVGTILDYTGYYSKDEIEKAESILKMNVTLNVFEKWKAKADFLYENGHFLLALQEYEKLLTSLEEDELDLRSRVYNNMGVTYMSLYLTDSAIDCFKRAYEINNSDSAYKHYLTAKRIKLSEDEYIRFLAEEENAYRVSVPLESELEAVKANFDKTEEAMHLKELFDLKDNRDASLYYEEITKITEGLKSDYRDMATEATDI